ncbi:MAG TPA: M20/M25/M40 family metallo-hydrolase [Bryobacteraceae bacterium]|nr:M20/M25/M40 family metallo-hydrolase [Bryobacteraceae bacterium]
MLRIGGAVFLFAAFCLAQSNPAALAARQYRQQHERAIVDEFTALLSIPNIASDHANIQRNAELIAKMLEKRGIAPRLVSIPGSNPVVFGEIETPGATRTLVFYAHYDGQPLDAKEWVTPPFSPVLRDKSLDRDGRVIPLPASNFDPESRIYARSAGDDKNNIMTLLTALDAIHSVGLKTKSNIKFVFEGEEEAGSINFGNILAANKQLFSGDMWFICDGPVHQTRRQLITFGARGITTVDITTYGPRRELHSGHYGNWAPNPAMMLAQLLASMKDQNGHVLVDHFYDGIDPLSETEKRAIADAPDDDAELMRELWLGRTENAPRKLADVLNEPSLNIRGMASSRVGEHASNVIPSTATVSIDMRLVKGMDHAQTAERLIEHIRRQGYFVVDHDPSPAERMAHPRVAKVMVEEGGYNAVRTSMDLPISQEIIRTIISARGPTVLMPTSGGSDPRAIVERVLGSRTIGIPTANHDDNQHTFNENLRMQNLWDGIELMSALLTM